MNLKPVILLNWSLGLGTAAEDLTANSEWLLKRLPRLPCFASYYPQISNALRFACQYENDPLGMNI